MKKFFIIIISVIFLLTLKSAIYAASKGTVNKYSVVISANKDGSINMTYNLSLIIGENGIDELTINLPHGNKTVINKDSNIDSIEISSDSKKATVKFNRIYSPGSSVNFSFSLRNSNVYEYNLKNDLVKYRITIGTVKGFDCQEATIKWNSSNVYFQGRSVEEGNYYVLRQNFSIIRSIQVVMQYKGQHFNLVDGNEKQNSISDYVIKYGLIGIAVVIISLELFVNDSYKKNKGFSLKNGGSIYA